MPRWIPWALSLGLTTAVLVFGAGLALRRPSPAREAPSPTVAPPTAQFAATLPTAPSTAEAHEPPSDDEVLRTMAHRMAGLRGDDLSAALWAFEQRAGPPPSYAQLERNAERYAGTAVMYSGEVLEIQDVPGQDGAFIRLDLGDSAERVIAVGAMAPPSDDVVRGRHVRVYGVLTGSFSYQSQAGWNLTIPKMQAVAVVLSSVPRRPRS